jgi:hypothetical protein
LYHTDILLLLFYFALFHDSFFLPQLTQRMENSKTAERQDLLERIMRLTSTGPGPPGALGVCDSGGIGGLILPDASSLLVRKRVKKI